MKRSIRKFWLEHGLVIAGAEDPTPEGDPGAGNDTDQDGDGKDGAEGDGDDESDDDDDSGDGADDKADISQADLEKLRKALREERKNRRIAERANKAASKTKADADDKQKSDEADARLEAAEKKAEKLAAGYRSARVEQVITKLAQAANVVDPSDMVALLKSQGYVDIDVDQDDDDPSKVDVDEDDVKAAIKKALKTRKHWIKKSSDDEDDEGNGSKNLPSGSKMRPGQQRKGKLEDEALKDAYPALRMRR